MYRVKLFSFIFILSFILLLLLAFSSSRAKQIKNDTPLSDTLSAGKQIFDSYCAACHGYKGNGDGEYANEMQTKPTDFTSGMYKFKSTPFGTLPTIDDIVSTLQSGVRTTAMIPQRQLDLEQMKEVAEYILSFAPKDEITGKPVVIPPEPEITHSFIGTGKKLFDTYCSGCHGKDAKGDGPSADKLVNYKGKPIKPANLTVRPLKRANTPDWMYKIINNGIEGTPMPAYFGTVNSKDIWAIVDYLNSLKIENLTNRRTGGMMGGMMGHNLVGEEYIGMRIDMAAARAWMMGSMMNR